MTVCVGAVNGIDYSTTTAKASLPAMNNDAVSGYDVIVYRGQARCGK